MIVLCIYVRVADMTKQLISLQTSSLDLCLQKNYQCYKPDIYQQTAGPTITYKPFLCTLYLGQVSLHSPSDATTFAHFSGAD